jgi:hypothetical protein
VTDLDWYDVPQAHKDNFLLTEYRCPKCFEVGQWRRGAEYDGEMRCGRGCNTTWSPYTIQLWREAVANELVNTGGDGI